MIERWKRLTRQQRQMLAGVLVVAIVRDGRRATVRIPIDEAVPARRR